MPIEKEILNMFEFSRNKKNTIFVDTNFDEYPLSQQRSVTQIDEPFRCIDIYNRKASVPLWVHPLSLANTKVMLFRKKEVM